MNRVSALSRCFAPCSLLIHVLPALHTFDPDGKELIHVS